MLITANELKGDQVPKSSRADQLYEFPADFKVIPEEKDNSDRDKHLGGDDGSHSSSDSIKDFFKNYKASKGKKKEAEAGAKSTTSAGTKNTKDDAAKMLAARQKALEESDDDQE